MYIRIFRAGNIEIQSTYDFILKYQVSCTTNEQFISFWFSVQLINIQVILETEIKTKQQEFCLHK